MINIIAAIGKNREIGLKGDLIFHLKEDMNFFRKTTTGHPVTMGYNTWKSLPAKLKNRTNIVISKREIPDADLVISDITKFITKYEKSPEEIFVIGGGMIYREFLPHAANLYLTEINATAPDADTFFPEFDKTKYTKTIIKKGTENGLDYSIVKYSKN